MPPEETTVAPAVPAVAPVAAPSDTPPLQEGAFTLDTALAQIVRAGEPADQSKTTPTPQSPDGQAPVAPVKAEGDDPVVPAKVTEGAPEPGQAPPEVKDDDVLAAMNLAESPEVELARTKREAGASRSEALRLKKVEEGIQEVLKKQGVELVMDTNGNVVGTAPTKDYNGGASEAMSLKFTDMSEAQQNAFESDPQALIDHVLSQAKVGMTRVAPTVEKPFATISPEAEKSAFDHVAGLLLEDGETKRHPNLETNKNIIFQKINAPSNSALKEFYNRHPDEALAMINAQVDEARAILTARAQKLTDANNKKKQEANATLSPGPSGGGEAVIVPAGASLDEQSKAIGKFMWAK